jgi:hypothetical protein
MVAMAMLVNCTLVAEEQTANGDALYSSARMSALREPVAPAEKGAPKALGLVDIEFTRIDTNIHFFGTYQSHNQKVVANANGIFLTYVVITTGNESDDDNTWKLMHSIDGGATFYTLDSGMAGTRAPAIETDEYSNIYITLPDWNAEDDQFYFIRYLASENYATAHTTTITGASSGAKYAMAYDQGRNRFYVGTQPGDLFTVGIDGVQVGGVQSVWTSGPTSSPQYPYLHLDTEGTLFFANTSATDIYPSIHAIRSDDGGASWTTLDKTPVTLPVACDAAGAGTMISGADELDVNTWLCSTLTKGGRSHYFYAVNDGGIENVPYMNYDTATGQRQHYRNMQQAGDQISVDMYDGFFATHDLTASSLLYAIMRDSDGRTACLYSPNNGGNWYDYALDTTEYNAYATGGARTVTPDGYIIGSFMARTPGSSGDYGYDVWFFKIDTSVPPNDTDGDDLLDDWENEYGLNPNNAADRDIDTDDDGATNYEEFLAGTDPTQAPPPGPAQELITFDDTTVNANSCMFKSSAVNDMNWREDPAAGSTITVESGKLKFGCPTNSAEDYTGMVYRAYLNDDSNALFQPGTTVEFTVKNINNVFTSPTRSTLQIDFASDTGGALTAIGTYGVFIEGNGYLYDVPGFEGGDDYNALNAIYTYTDIRYKFEFTDTTCTTSMDTGGGYVVQGTYNYKGNINISGADGIEMQIFPHSWSSAAYHPYDFYIDDLTLTAPDWTYLPGCVDSVGDTVLLRDNFLSLDTNGSNGLSHAEAQVKIPSMSQQAFDFLDGDGDDELSLQELIEAINGSGPADPVYVNFSNTGDEDGASTSSGFDTLLEGASYVTSGGTVIISGGNTNETIYIPNPMTLQASGGTVRIGTSSGAKYLHNDSTTSGIPIIQQDSYSKSILDPLLSR